MRPLRPPLCLRFAYPTFSLSRSFSKWDDMARSRSVKHKYRVPNRTEFPATRPYYTGSKAGREGSSKKARTSFFKTKILEDRKDNITVKDLIWCQVVSMLILAPIVILCTMIKTSRRFRDRYRDNIMFPMLGWLIRKCESENWTVDLDEITKQQKLLQQKHKDLPQEPHIVEDLGDFRIGTDEADEHLGMNGDSEMMKSDLSKRKVYTGSINY
eukprot:201881_1